VSGFCCAAGEDGFNWVVVSVLAGALSVAGEIIPGSPGVSALAP